MKVVFFLCTLSAIAMLTPISALAQRNSAISVDQVMSAEELHATGVSTLSATQRHQLDLWLNRYTALLLGPNERKTKSDCDPAIETQIDGEFNGWEGDTIYKLRIGQIWY